MTDSERNKGSEVEMVVCGAKATDCSKCVLGTAESSSIVATFSRFFGHVPNIGIENAFIRNNFDFVLRVNHILRIMCVPLISMRFPPHFIYEMKTILYDVIDVNVSRSN